MTEQEGKLTAAILSQDLIDQLDQIKAYHGLVSTSDAIRMLIRQEWRRVSAQLPLPLPSESR